MKKFGQTLTGYSFGVACLAEFQKVCKETSVDLDFAGVCSVSGPFLTAFALPVAEKQHHRLTVHNLNNIARSCFSDFTAEHKVDIEEVKPCKCGKPGILIFCDGSTEDGKLINETRVCVGCNYREMIAGYKKTGDLFSSLATRAMLYMMHEEQPEDLRNLRHEYIDEQGKPEFIEVFTQVNKEYKMIEHACEIFEYRYGKFISEKTLKEFKVEKPWKLELHSGIGREQLDIGRSTDRYYLVMNREDREVTKEKPNPFYFGGTNGTFEEAMTALAAISRKNG